MSKEDRLRILQEEMAEISLRVEKLERAMPLESSGSSVVVQEEVNGRGGFMLGGSRQDQG